MVNNNLYNSSYGSNSKGAMGYNGVKDWLVQRKTAVVLGLYFVYMLYFFATNNNLSYQAWHELFQPIYFKVITIIVLISLIKHVWIGLWTIATDYLHNLLIRSLFLFLCKILLIIYLIWGIYILFAN